jgi:putative flippase GtrA
LTRLPSTERAPVTCPSLLRRRPAVPEFVGDLPRATPADDDAAPLLDRIRRDDATAQFARFVLVGGASTLVYAALFVALQPFGYLSAHLVATVASSILANELHRRLTFRAEHRVHWLTAQVEAGGVSFLGLVATSIALGWLNETAGSAPVALQIALVAVVTAVIGLMRFLALRWIFRPTASASA